jgi:hypothetical protein
MPAASTAISTSWRVRLPSRCCARRSGSTRAALADAIAWLVDYRLIEGDREAGWRTGSDPWELVMRALDERRRRELAPALTVLRECQRELRGVGDAVAMRRSASF